MVRRSRRLALGLDTSTQGFTAVVIDIDSKEILRIGDGGKKAHSLDYLKDPRLNIFGINDDYILPPRVKGEADQPPKMFFTALDAMCNDLKERLGNHDLGLEDIVVINHSGQQHGHFYWNEAGLRSIENLKDPESAEKDLVANLEGGLAYLTAPIWMTANTNQEADALRRAAGGKEAMIQLSGSDSPLRFTGAIASRVAGQFPEAFTDTVKIELIGNAIPSILAGNSKTNVDWANGCGMSLMDYQRKQWSNELMEGAAQGTEFSSEDFQGKFPGLASPDDFIGNISQYFVQKHGFNPNCKIVRGSGDNPQTKVLVPGDLLSLGTSFVNMVSTKGETFDMQGYANAMYDGVDRPFMFGCRTNGAAVWDKAREEYGLGKKEYGPAEKALTTVKPGSLEMVFWQPRSESFPVSGELDLIRLNNDGDVFEGESTLGRDYGGIIDTSLAAVYLYSKGFARQTNEPLYVAGGANESPGVMRRVRGIWGRPTIPIEVGAALGAAVAGARAYLGSEGSPQNIDKYSQEVLGKKTQTYPDAADVDAYHREGGYLKRIGSRLDRLVSTGKLAV
jgi:xylulokinase